MTAIYIFKYFLYVMCPPAISAFIYSRHTPDACLFEKICSYGVFAVAVRLIIVFPVLEFINSLGVKFEDGSLRYFLFSSILSVVLPYIALLLRKYFAVRLEAKAKADEK